MMPNDRRVAIDCNDAVVGFDDSCIDPDDSEVAIKFQDRGEHTSRVITHRELEIKFQFNYSRFLIFSHEKLLRQSLLSKYTLDETGESEDDLSELHSLKSKVYSGFISPFVCVRHVGEIADQDVGFGLFAEETIPCGSLLGEYVGVVGCHSSYDPATTQTYCCQYASCDGDMYVNALEYGNIIRFINHSSQPNAQLKVLQFDGLPHVLCVRTLPIYCCLLLI